MLPHGYRRCAGTGFEGFAWEGAAEWLGSILIAGETLYAWAAARATDEGAGGRGPVHVVRAPVPGPEARAAWAVRHYRRGGLLSRLSGDRYLAWGQTRPWHEVTASVEARRRGVRTPAVVAGAIHRSGPFYQADLVTELVPRARTLAEVALGGAGPHRAAALEASGQLVRALEEAGVEHRDLNASNVLLAEEGSGLQGWVIDLDRCRVGPSPATGPSAMRRRLERSLRKVVGPDLRLHDAEWRALHDGWGTER